MSDLLSPHIAKHFIMSDTLYIPDHKPDLKRISETLISPSVVDYKYTLTPQGLSYENLSLSGLALSVLIGLDQKTTYISNTYEETIHAVHFHHFKS